MTANDTGGRAPAMSPDQRREMIVGTAIPLLAENGASVTTAQIARAAGIAEGTVFRVFADKNALLQACIAAVLDPARVLDELGHVSREQPVTERLLKAADTLDAYFARNSAVLGALLASGEPGGGASPDADHARAKQRRNSRQESQAAIRQGIADLLAPEEDRLRLSADTFADAFLKLMFGHGAGPLATGDDRRSLIELLLHGAVRSET